MPYPVGSELASQRSFLLERAEGELNVKPRLGRIAWHLAPLFLRLFGVPEVGMRLRIAHVLSLLPEGVDSVIDIGCGAGFFLAALHHTRQTSSIVGIDVDQASVAAASATHPYADIACANVLDYEGGPFDAAVSIDVLEHLSDDDLPKFLRRAQRLLKPNGVLVLHVPAANQRRFFASFKHWEHHDHKREGFTRSDLLELVRQNGFIVNHCAWTIGPVAAFCWELNMLFAGRILQAAIFPVLLAAARLYDHNQVKGNGLVLSATRSDL